MSRLIDADKEVCELRKMNVGSGTFVRAVNFAIEVLENAPTIEPDRKTGRWIGDVCSVCGEERAWYGNNPPYCPNCGSYNGGDEE